ncbi:hypothetical protein GCM10009660_46250 [Catellatospora bangladeshensis]
MATSGRTGGIGFSPGGGDRQGGTSATTREGGGPVGPAARAADHLIASGEHAEAPDRRGLGATAVAEPEVDPPDLPGTRPPPAPSRPPRSRGAHARARGPAAELQPPAVERSGRARWRGVRPATAPRRS